MHQLKNYSLTVPLFSLQTNLETNFQSFKGLVIFCFKMFFLFLPAVCLPFAGTKLILSNDEYEIWLVVKLFFVLKANQMSYSWQFVNNKNKNSSITNAAPFIPQ